MNSKKNIYLSGIFDVNSHGPFDLVALEEYIDTRIDFRLFGDGLEELTFIYIVLPKENDLHRASKYFSSKKKRLMIRARMEDYPYFCSLTKSEAVHELARFFIQTLKNYHPAKGMNFDWEKFVKALDTFACSKGAMAAQER